MTSIRWLGSPTSSAASPTSHRAGFPNCCHGIGNIRTCGWPLELWQPSPTSSRSGVLPSSWAAMKTCYGSCPTSSSPKTGSCGFTISMALKPPPSPTMASRLFAKLSRIRSIAPVNLKTSVPRCSADAYSFSPTVPDHLARSYRLLAETLDVIENDAVYRNKMPKCEPQLGKYGLYGAIGGTSKLLPPIWPCYGYSIFLTGRIRCSTLLIVRICHSHSFALQRRSCNNTAFSTKLGAAICEESPLHCCSDGNCVWRGCAGPPC